VAILMDLIKAVVVIEDWEPLGYWINSPKCVHTFMIYKYSNFKTNELLIKIK